MDFGMEMNIDIEGRMAEFWDQMRDEIQNIKPDAQQLKAQELPLARIKKIMKLDEDVKMMMISAEAPVLLAKAAEIFVRELTLRAWLHTERCRRRTLQRIDISSAIYDSNTDQFDFLIDIVPREEVKAAYGMRRPNPNEEGGQMNYGSPTQQVVNTGGSMSMHESSAPQMQTSVSFTPQQTTQLVSSGPGNAILQTIPSGSIVTSNQNQMAPQQIVINTSDPSLGQQVLTASNAQNMGQQTIQYVLQLPSSSALGNQPIQIQVIPPNAYTLSDGQMSQQPQLIQLVPQVITIPATVNNSQSVQPTVITTTTGQPTHQQVSLQQVIGQSQIVYTTNPQQLQGQQIVMTTSQPSLPQAVAVVAKQEPTDVNLADNQA